MRLPGEVADFSVGLIFVFVLSGLADGLIFLYAFILAC